MMNKKIITAPCSVNSSLYREAEQRLAADQERVVHRIRPPLQADRDRGPRDARAQHEPRQPRRPDRQRFVQAMDRKRRERIETPVALFAHLFRRRHQRLRRLKLHQRPDQPFLGLVLAHGTK
jgi:hypothetical protein